MIFLLHRWDPGIGIGHLARVYWPLLIVLWGIAKLVDHFVAQSTGQVRAPLLSAGEAVLLVLLAVILFVFGLGDWAHQKAPWLRIDIPAFHDSYSQHASIAPQTIPAGAHVSIETENGSLTIHGSGGSQLLASASESARAENEWEADQRMKSVEVVLEKTANGYAIHPVHQSDFRGTLEVDLDVQLPEAASVTVSTRRGDINVSGIGGAVDARTESGDLEIHNVGADVAAQTGKGDVRIDQVGGSVTLKGRGGEVEIGEVRGNVALDGAFVGDTVMRKVGGTAQLASPWADLSVAQLTGRLEMDAGDLSVSDAGGAARLQTHDKDIEAENIGGPLDISDSHGDVKVLCSTQPREALNVSNQSGDVELSLPARSSFQITAYSRSGEASSEFESPSLRITGEESSGRLEGQFAGNSATTGPKITVNTSYGTISLRKS